MYERFPYAKTDHRKLGMDAIKPKSYGPWMPPRIIFQYNKFHRSDRNPGRKSVRGYVESFWPSAAIHRQSVQIKGMGINIFYEFYLFRHLGKGAYYSDYNTLRVLRGRPALFGSGQM